MENIKEYTIRRMDISMLDDLTALHQAVYDRSVPDDHFRAKLDTAYTGAQFIGYMAYTPHNIPIAYYGVIPCLLQYKDRLILSAQSADTMTDPRFRFKGMFVELSRITFELCRASGIHFIFGFPNENSLHGAVNKLGWQQADTMDRFTIPVKGLPLRKASVRWPRLEPFYHEYCRVVLKRYMLPLAGLSGKFAAEDLGGVYRDESYLRYKTYHPTAVLRIGNTMVWMRIREGLFLGDLQCAGKALNADDITESMRTLQSIARRLGLPFISFIVSRGTRLHTLFSALYPAQPSFPVLIQDFGSGLDASKIKFSFADLDIF